MGYEAAKAQTNLAISLTHHGDTAGRLELFREARQLFDHENNRAWIATIDLYQALVYYQDHRLDEALELCDAPGVFRPVAALHQKRAVPAAAGAHPSGSRADRSRRARSAWPRSTDCGRRKRRPRATRPGTCSA